MVEFLSVSLHGRNGSKRGAPRGSASKADGGANASTTTTSASPGAGVVDGSGSPSSRSASRTRYGGGGARSLSRPRKTWHDDLKAVEAARRSKCGQLMDMIRLNIASYKGLLDDSSVETTKAHRLVLGVSQVHDLMSSSSLLDPPQLRPEQLAPPAGQESSTNGNSNNNDFLLSLQQSEEVVSENFKSSAEQLQTVDGKLLKSLAEIQDYKADLDTQGGAIVASMVSLEEQTVQAWGAYLQTVSAVHVALVHRVLFSHACVSILLCADAYLEAVQASRRKAPGKFSDFFSSSSHGSGSAGAAEGTSGGGATSAGDESNNDDGDDNSKPNSGNATSSGKVDPWLAELQYRQALQAQKATMDGALKELEELFGQVSNYECRRRINLREYMILTCTSTKWVFTGAEAAQAVAVRDWIEKDTSAATIQEQVSASVKERIEAMLAEQEANGGSDENNEENPVDENEDGDDDDEVGQPPEGADSDPVSVAMFYAGLFPATSPLESDFLATACVVERVFPNQARNDAAGRPKYVALAVVTSDQMLHLFDVKEGTDIALDDPPERALDAVLKEMANSAASSTGSSSAGSARDFGLDPSRTIDLTQMEATLGSGDNLVELKLAPGATQSYPPLCLRTFSAREQVELINAIHGDSIKAMF
jgi:hypothetical protein